MPKLDQILKDIDRRYPNSFSQSDKIDWVNDVQTEVFRELAKEEIINFQTIKGTSIYGETKGLNFSLIQSVTIDNKQYDFVGLNDEIKDHCYSRLADGSIVFYPEISQDDLDVYIYYQKKPKEIRVLSEKPELDENYHDILKFGVMRIIAQANSDIALVNNYTQEYNALLTHIKQEKYEKAPSYPKIKQVGNYRWR